MRRPAVWIAFAALAVAAALVGVRYFPDAFSIVALDITMDRGRALRDARAIAARDGLGPPAFQQAASFGGDQEAQTFVELEGGGKEAFTRMLREGLYAAYRWRVRHFRDGETNETTIVFRPDGRPYGFTETLKEDAPGAALDAARARRIAEDGATGRWGLDLPAFTLVEQGQERRPGGRVDHTFTYERAGAAFGEGRLRVRLVVSGDRLTGVSHFVKIPEAFARRYESMRSANDLIGIGSTVGLALLYVIGGIGVGLFFMMRRRWVVWRPAAAWGIAVGGLQALAAANQFPLIWMSYDTAIPRSTFLAQQAALIGAAFVGFSVFFALSFMAAETLTRRAFGSHPQLWRAWGRDAGPSIQILGRTVSGYLLVPLFIAYDVILYLVMTKVFGWWSPAEALIHPDVLATYAPWLSAIANSFQAGFWEEALFRAVPIAGAALIGDRFGRRRLFIVAAFAVQAAIFGAGHAPYPNQPAYARPVELILPSIGFGLLYLYFGLLPAIVLHFAFDVVWFALPIFLADAPGIWFQQLMVVALALVPLWIALWRRARARRWTELSPSLLNAAWTPPPAPERGAFVFERPRRELPRGARRAWLAAGAAALVAVVALAANSSPTPYGSLPVSRARAESAAREALRERGVTLAPRWRVMPVPDDGSGGPHQFVYETAGEARWRELLGVYLPKPRWRVRVATFTGDVAERAEEWHVFVDDAAQVTGVRHIVPEGREGAALDEAAARQAARAAVQARFGLSGAQLKEVSARPAKQKARTDWTFTFSDTTIAPLPQGEPRIDAAIAGDEVTAVFRHVFVPEAWERQQRAASTRNVVLQIATAVIFGGLLLAAAIGGMMAWSRGHYAPRVFLAAAALMLLVSIAGFANGWPSVVASLSTAAPLMVQAIGGAGVALVGLTLLAALIGLAVGALPRPLAGMDRVPDRDAAALSIAAGCAGAAAVALAGTLRTPPWARFPDLQPLGTAVPLIDQAIDPIGGLLMRMAIVMAACITLDRVTAAWTRNRGRAIAALAVVGFLSGGPPAGTDAIGWAAGGLVTAAALVIAFVTLLRFDATLVPPALAVMGAAGILARAARQPYPDALAGGVLGAAVALAVGHLWFRALRRRAPTPVHPAI
jgi:membrane protease YdiL (CAAX protease family)